jgi:cell division protein FtsI/penicillin-binding protein 2
MFDVISISIGQGEVNLTPLHIAISSYIANRDIITPPTCSKR